MDVVYFAFGSNMSEAQMRARCPSARIVGPAQLNNHELLFVGHSTSWGGAVATVTPRRGSRVRGVLYRMERADLDRLDRFEGHPFAYRRQTKQVLDGMRRPRRAEVYVRDAGESARPSFCYLQTIWKAYGRHGFDVQPLLTAAGVKL